MSSGLINWVLGKKILSPNKPEEQLDSEKENGNI